MDEIDRQRQVVALTLKDLSRNNDCRLLLPALLATASIMAERMIAAGVRTPDWVQELFAGACADALTPTGEIPQVYSTPESDNGQKH